MGSRIGWFRSRWFLIAVVVAVAGMLFMAGILAEREGFLSYSVKPIAARLLSPLNYLSSLTVQPEQLTIDIGYRDFQQLAYNREVAINRQLLVASDRAEVPATIRYKDKSIKVKMRLKGDLPEHWEHKYKWSFRIRTRGENTIMGMKQFSLQRPETRSFLYEWVFHQALAREDVIALRYKFVNLILNGRDLGVYALEEHFEKRLVENNRRREGPIIRFNEDLLWSPNAHSRFRELDTEAYLSSEIDAFQTGRVLADSSLRNMFRHGVDLLTEFRRGILKTSQVFDVGSLARYTALCDLFGGEHAMRWHNKRFYFNPVTELLEPVGFDANAGFLIHKIVLTTRDEFGLNRLHQNTLFDDAKFVEAYLGVLERISQPSYIDNLLAELSDSIDMNLKILYRDYPKVQFDREILDFNQKFIRKVMAPVKGLQAYFRNGNDNSINLELGNIQAVPIIVTGVVLQDSIPIEIGGDVRLPAKPLSRPVEYHAVAFNLPDQIRWSDSLAGMLKVRYHLLGTTRDRFETVFAWSHLDETFIADNFLRQTSNLAEMEFLTIDESNRRVTFKAGRWELADDLIIPEGYTVICGPGTHLNLTKFAKILIRSPLFFAGTEDSPITITSDDSTGQGLVVLGAKEMSYLEYVVFKNLSNPAKDGWALTGAVTFYESAVQMSHCEFVGNRCEDGLNIIRSDFKLENCLFSDTQSDAFDGDFCVGEITGCSFVASGNDAIDVSGSEVELRDVYVNVAGDKGVSFGENSRAKTHNLIVKNAEIAVAVKDLSSLTLRGGRLDSCAIGFTAYQKKPEFGPAVIDAVGVGMNGLQVPFLVEKNSTMMMDSVIITSNQERVKDLLYGVKFGKSSK